MLKSIIYGIVQGLTEFLPVSSSGHLAVFQALFGEVLEGNVVTYTLLLHVGTLAAVILVYYKDVWALMKSFVSVMGKLFTGKFKYKSLNDSEKFFCLLFIALIPLALGAVLEGKVEELSELPLAVGIFWIICAFMFIFAESDRVQKAIKAKKFDNIKPKHAFGVGLFQLFAILPGISRSGSTIIGGVLHGFKREFAVKFSFILSIPAILGSTIVSVAKDYNEISLGTQAGPIIAGVIASFISGLCAIKLLEYISSKHNFKVFAHYLFIIGTFIIGFEIGKAAGL